MLILRESTTVNTLKKKNRRWDLSLAHKSKVEKSKNRLFTILADLATAIFCLVTPPSISGRRIQGTAMLASSFGGNSKFRFTVAKIVDQLEGCQGA